MADQNFNNVVLLLPFDGVNGATTTTDLSNNPKAATFVAGAHLDTTDKVFGTASLNVPASGGGDAVTFADTDEFWIGINPFTIRCWVQFSATGGNPIICGQWGGNFVWWVRSGNLSMRDAVSGDTQDYPWTPTIGTWYHLQIERSAIGTLRQYLDGVMVAKNTGWTGAFGNSGSPFAIGSASPALGGGTDFPGRIDDFEFYNGTCLCDSDAGFTVPAAPNEAVGTINTFFNTMSPGAGSWGGLTVRNAIDLASLTTTGDNSRICFRASPGATLDIAYAYIGRAATDGSGLDFLSTPTQIFFGGNPNVSIGSGDQAISDTLTGLTIDDTHDFVISYFLSAGGGQTPAYGTNSGPRALWFSGDVADDLTVSGGNSFSGTIAGVAWMSLDLSSVASITSISPTDGLAAGGTPVTIIGTGFTGATDVQFDGSSATSIVVVDDAHITCDTPAHAVGVVNLQVFTPLGDPILPSAYRYGDPEIKVTQAPILILDLSPQPTRVTQVPVLVLYQEEQPNRITQVPIHVLYVPKPVPMPDPVVPEVPVTEIWAWKTALNQSHVGKEQRTRLRNVPRYKLGFDVITLNEEDRVNIYNMLMRYMKQTFPYPMYQYSTKLTAKTLAGNIQINVDLTKTDIRVGEQVAVFDPSLTKVYYFTVLSLGSGFFFTSAAVPFDIPEHWYVAPAPTFRILPIQGLNMSSISGGMSLSLESTVPRIFQRPGAAPTLTTIDGITIITDRHLADDGIKEDFNHGATWFDNDQSIPEILNEWSNPHVEGTRQYKFIRNIRIDYWRAVCDSLKGMQGVALFPTFRNDIALREPIALSAKQFDTDNIHFYKWWLDVNYAYISIWTANGVIYRRVIDVVPHYDADGIPYYMTVKLRDAIGGSAGDNDIVAISYMNLCRLNTDEVTVVHSDVDSIISFTIKAVDK